MDLEEDENNFIPCKLPLCMICVSPITSSDHVDSEEKEGEHDVTISKETFLKGITILCNNLNLEDTFGREEEWTKVLGTRGNFVGSVCCGRCSELLRNLVELHELIVRTEVKLKECVNLVELSVVNSLGLAAEAEYSISTCLRFREEVFKSFQIRRNQNVMPSVPASRSLSRKRKTIAKPLSVKRRLETKLKEEALIRPAQVKLERLPPASPVSVPVVANEDEVDSEHEDYCPSPIAEDGEDGENNYDEDEEFRPRRRRYRGTLDEFGRQRKRGRPPKPRDPNEVKIVRPRGRPRTREPKPKRPRGRPPKNWDLEFLNMPMQNDTDVQEQEAVGLTPVTTPDLPESAEPSKVIKTELKLKSVQVETVDAEDDEDYQPISEVDDDDDPQSEPESDLKSNSKEKKTTPSSTPSKPDRRLRRLDDPFNDRRKCRKVQKLLNDDGPYYLKPMCVLNASTGALSFYNCKIQIEHNRLVCQHPNCDFEVKFEYFSISMFYAFRGLRYHIKMEHRSAKKPTELNLEEDESESSSKGYHYCAYCDTQFERRFFLIQHVKSDHPDAKPYPSLCEVCGMVLPHDQLLDHIFTHKSERERQIALGMTSNNSGPGKMKDPTLPAEFPCDKCDQVFKDYTSIRLHFTTHIPIELRRQFQCDMCPEKLSSLNSLKLHINVVHFKEKQPRPYECKICGRKFGKYQRELYEAHVRLHTGEVPFQCAECGKGFRVKRLLKQHELLHRDTQMPCEYCSNVYKNIKYLRRHHKKHHPEMVSRNNTTRVYASVTPVELRPEYHGPKLMYPCEPCGKVYIYKSQLIPHLRHAHKIVYPKSSDYPNMLTTEDDIAVNHHRNRAPKPKPSASAGEYEAKDELPLYGQNNLFSVSHDQF